jgi:hypothetical protein
MLCYTIRLHTGRRLLSLVLARLAGAEAAERQARDDGDGAGPLAAAAGGGDDDNVQEASAGAATAAAAAATACAAAAGDGDGECDSDADSDADAVGTPSLFWGRGRSTRELAHGRAGWLASALALTA